MAKNKLIVISADAMVSEDIQILNKLPNFKRFFKECSMVEKVRGIYPSLTFPAHVSLITGLYPDRHGVTTNYVFDILKTGRQWLWRSDAIKADTIFTAAKRNGLTTSAVGWPVSASNPDIDYLVGDIWPTRGECSQEECFAMNGSNDEVMEIIRKSMPLWKSDVNPCHPEYDDFTLSCACDIIEKFTPDLMLIHFANIDSNRHQNGVFCDEVNRSIIETDYYLGQLVMSAKKAGIYDNTNFILLSDHGQLDVKRSVNPNVVFASEGLINTDGDGNVIDWSAYSMSIGASSHIYLKDKCDRVLWQKTYDLLTEMCESGLYGIIRVYTLAEVQKEHRLSGDFSFVIETDGYTTFSDNTTGSVVTPLTCEDYRVGKATHGYLPHLGPQPIFIAKGPGVKKNIILESGNLVDAAPTMARLLEIELTNTDGKAFEELLTT